MRRSLAIAVALMLAACSGPSGPETITTSTSVPEQYDWSWTEPSSLPVVTVLDPGADPRSVLVFELTVGQVTRATMVMEFAMTGRAGGETASSQMAVEAVMELEVIDRRTEGFVTSSRYLSFSVRAPDAATKRAVEELYANLVGIPLMSLTAPSGATLAVSADWDRLGGASDVDLHELWSQLKSDLGSLTAPLPEEPVGVGAVWEVVTRFEADGVALLQTARYQLVDRTESRVMLSFQLEQAHDPDAAVAPGLELDVSGTGSGSSELDLNSGLPTSSQIEMNSVMGMTLTQGGETQEATMRTRVAVRLTSE